MSCLPMAKAVSKASPVIIFTATPEPLRTSTASLTPSRGGSMIPTRPKKVNLPSSGPEAKASTKMRKEDWDESYFFPVKLLAWSGLWRIQKNAVGIEH